MLEIARAVESELAEVAAFYAEVGYGGLQAGDTLLLARSSGGLVGAVRLREEEGFLILRGMYVGRDRRRAGVGAALLRAAGQTIGDRPCWCVPYAHLRAFYAREGFAEVEARGAPAFLVARSAGYREKGEDVILALRPAGWRPSRVPV